MVEFKSISLESLVKRFGLTPVAGSAVNALTNLEVCYLGEPLEVSAKGLAFLISESFISTLPEATPDVLIVSEALVERVKAKLNPAVKVMVQTPDAYLVLAQFSEIVANADEFADWRVGSYKDSPEQLKGNAYIHPTAEVHPTASIAPFSSVGAKAKVGARSVLLPNVHIGPGSEIGEDSVLFSGCVVYPKIKIGNRVRIHSNAVIGSDGFGYARGPRGATKIWHLGRVVLHDDVEIGAGTTIDRGTMKDTVVEQGAKIDNQVQIGHNGYIKSHAIICAQVGLAGNVTVGRGSILAGKVGVADKVEIGDGVTIGASSGVSKDVKSGEVIMGALMARPRKEWWKLAASFERLPSLLERIKKLESDQS